MNRNISSSDDYFFNEKFQKLLEMDDSYNKNVLLSEHTTDFVYAVETFGKIIISERYLPYEEKTIKPIKLGGIAGGEK